MRAAGRPDQWLHAAAGLAWPLSIPVEPRLHELVGEHRPLPLVAQANLQRL